MSGLYNIKVKDMKNNEVSLSDYKGKVLLIVNTATKCGYTPQYDGLQNLYEKYRAQGFEILDFPCDQFGHQAPGTSEEIFSFCVKQYHIDFKQFAKIDVNGPNESPLYSYLKSQKSGVLNSKIKWNFTKFLIDREGNVVNRYASADVPEKLDEAIAKLLEQN